MIITHKSLSSGDDPIPIENWPNGSHFLFPLNMLHIKYFQAAPVLLALSELCALSSFEHR